MDAITQATYRLAHDIAELIADFEAEHGPVREVNYQQGEEAVTVSTWFGPAQTAVADRFTTED